MSQYEDQEEADEGGQEVEVQEEVWAPAEPSGRDASPSRLELQKQGRLASHHPGYGLGSENADRYIFPGSVAGCRVTPIDT